MHVENKKEAKMQSSQSNKENSNGFLIWKSNVYSRIKYTIVTL